MPRLGPSPSPLPSAPLPPLNCLISPQSPSVPQSLVPPPELPLQVVWFPPPITSFFSCSSPFFHSFTLLPLSSRPIFILFPFIAPPYFFSFLLSPQNNILGLFRAAVHRIKFWPIFSSFRFTTSLKSDRGFPLMPGQLLSPLSCDTSAIDQAGVDVEHTLSCER